MLSPAETPTESPDADVADTAANLVNQLHSGPDVQEPASEIKTEHDRPDLPSVHDDEQDEVDAALESEMGDESDDLVSSDLVSSESVSSEEELEQNPDQVDAELSTEEPVQIGGGVQAGPIPLPHLIESLLFVSEEPVEPVKLAQALGQSQEAVDAALEELRHSYEEQNRGLRIQRRAGRLQLVTNPAAADAVEDFLNLDLSSRLSKPALEALAIVAYRQPVTRAQIEAVRGVDCSGVLRKLQQLGLVEEVGRLDVAGRPILYGVTDLFLQHFGLTSLEELPELPAPEADSLTVAVALAEE